MHVGEDESFYRPVNISDNDWRDIVVIVSAMLPLPFMGE